MTALENRIVNYWQGTSYYETACKAESEFQTKCIEMLYMLNALVVREAEATKAGTADVLACFNGRFIAIECKDDEGTPSPLQEEFVKRVISAGGSAAVCRTLKEVLHVLYPENALFKI